MQPIIIFEACHAISNSNSTSCYSRRCNANITGQCLSNKCINGRCVINSENPIYYCSNEDSDKFNCKLFRNEPCNKDDDCYSNRCNTIDSINGKVCLEPKNMISNITVGIISYTVVLISLVSLYFFYKHRQSRND